MNIPSLEELAAMPELELAMTMLRVGRHTPHHWAQLFRRVTGPEFAAFVEAHNVPSTAIRVLTCSTGGNVPGYLQWDWYDERFYGGCTGACWYFYAMKVAR